MFLRPFGRVIFSKVLHPANAVLAIAVISDGIAVAAHPRTSVFVAVSMIALQLFLLSYTGFSLSTVIFDKYEQFSNTSSPKDVTPFGIFILLNLAPLNAPSPIVFTLSGIVMLFISHQ